MGRNRKNTYVKYYQKYPYSGKKNQVDSRNELSNYRDYSQSYAQR